MRRWLVSLGCLSLAAAASGCRRAAAPPDAGGASIASLPAAADAGLSDEEVLAASLARLQQFKRQAEEAEAAARQASAADAGRLPADPVQPAVALDERPDREVNQELAGLGELSLEDAVERVHTLFRQHDKSALPALHAVCRAARKQASGGNAAGADRALKRLRDLPTGDAAVRLALSQLASELAMTSTRAAHYEQARVQARAALELEETNPQAYLVLGELEFQGNDLSGAMDTWEHGLRLNPADVALGQRLERAKVQIARVGGLERLSSEHFVVAFDGRADVPAARATLEVMEDAYRKVGALFQQYPDGPIPLVLYPHGSFADQGHASWSAGVYDGKIRLPAEGAAAQTLGFKGTLFHEYAHALFHRSTAGTRAPSWLNEGFADVAKLRGDPGPALLCQRSVHSFPLKSLHGGFGSLNRHNAFYAYLEARHAVERIIERHGEQGMRALLATLATEPDFARAFERALGQDYETFARSFDGEIH